MNKEINSGLKQSCELLQQLVYAGAKVQLWVDATFATVLTIEEADGQIGVTTMHSKDATQKQQTLAVDAVFSVILSNVPATEEQGKEARNAEPYGD